MHVPSSTCSTFHALAHSPHPPVHTLAHPPARAHKRYSCFVSAVLLASLPGLYLVMGAVIGWGSLSTAYGIIAATAFVYGTRPFLNGYLAVQVGDGGRPPSVGHPDGVCEKDVDGVWRIYM